MRRFFALITLLFFVNSINAQDILPLEQAIATALKNNYDILLVKNDSTSFAIDNSYSYVVFLPNVNGSATKVWNTNNQRQELADGSKRALDNARSTTATASVSVNWVLFDGLKMFATRERFAEMQKLGGLTVRNQVVNTVAAVINNYYNIVRAKQQLKAVEEQISISEERVKLADKKLSVGLGSKPELLQARVDLNAQKAVQLAQQTAIGQLIESLNQQMGMAGKSYVYAVEDSIPLNLDLQYGNLVNNIDNTNPGLLMARKNIDIANISLIERKRERWPVISFNSAYNFSRTDNKAVVNPFTPLFSQNNGYNYGFGASVPILNGFNTKRLIQQAKLDIEYQKLTYDSQRNILDANLANAFKDYEYQKKALTLEEENIQLAKENVNIALARFRQGVSTYLELREAQISLADAYDRLIAARYNTKLAETELMRLKGDLVR
jgi:outer membrane protein